MTSASAQSPARQPAADATPQAGPRVVFGRADRLAADLTSMGARAAVVIAGGRSFHRPEVQNLLTELRIYMRVVGGFAGNPTPADVARAADAINDSCDAIIAIGGGGVMDVAKCASILSDQSALSINNLLLGLVPLAPRRRPLCLLPTTAGSGSEVTPFATLYWDDRKVSVDDPALSATHAYVDPMLVRGAPRDVAASSALDALCHSVESYWSIHSTARSRRRAMRALILVLRHVHDAVLGNEPHAVSALSLAACLAGSAIAETRTTAAHAVSYGFTYHLGVPHGAACALALPFFITFNADVNAEDVEDLRGAAFVRDRVQEVCRAFGVEAPSAASAAVRRLSADLGLTTALQRWTRADLSASLSMVDPKRLGNNPRRVTLAALQRFSDGLVASH